MTQTRTRRPTRTHRITTRLLRSQKRRIEFLAGFNGVSFNDQLMAMLLGEMAKA
jgi:hypothetical protein